MNEKNKSVIRPFPIDDFLIVLTECDVSDFDFNPEDISFDVSLLNEVQHHDDDCYYNEAQNDARNKLIDQIFANEYIYKHHRAIDEVYTPDYSSASYHAYKHNVILFTVNKDCYVSSNNERNIFEYQYAMNTMTRNEITDRFISSSKYKI